MTYSENDKKLLWRMVQLGPACAIEEMIVEPERFEDAGLREFAMRIDDEYRSYIDEIYDYITFFDDAIESIEEDQKEKD